MEQQKQKKTLLSASSKSSVPAEKKTTEQIPAVQQGRKQGKSSPGTDVISVHRQALSTELHHPDKEENIVRIRGGVDRVMLALILILLALGSIMVFSASYPSALAKEGDSLYYIKKHLVFVALGITAMFIISRFSIGFIEDATPWLFLVAAALLVLVLIPSPLSISQGAARRWLNFKVFTMQPSELMKAALILMLARYLSRHQIEREKHTLLLPYLWRSTLFPCVFLGIACVLVLAENHLSGTLIMGAIGVCEMLVGGVPILWLLLIALIGLVCLGVPFLMTQDYAWERLETYFNKESADVLDELWQTTQGQYAIGSGGLLGTGLGGSRQKYSYVSEPQNDFIFTIWCEEMGFVGAVAVIVLYLLFIWRCIVIAMRAPDTFSALAVLGIAGQVGIQAFLNIGVVTGVLPNTGVSLPFFSYGGTSLIFLMAEMGVVLAVSRRSYIRK